MDVRTRAAKELDIPSDAATDTAVSAFLARLTRMDWVPAGETVAAVNALAGQSLPTETGSSPTLGDEVEEFVDRYWYLPPAERLATWLALSTRSPDDAVAARLLSLQAGLDVTATPLANPTTDELARLTRELYLLPPRPRSLRRNQWLLDNAFRHVELIAAARALQKEQPWLAALEPVLFARLTAHFDAVVFAEAAAAEPVPVLTHPSLKPLVFPEIAPPRTRPPSVRIGELLVSSGSAKYFIWIVMGGVFIAVKGLSGVADRPNPPPVNTRPEFNYEQFRKSLENAQPIKKVPSLPVFSEAEVLACKNYELLHLQNTFTPKPPCYDDWVWRGKPQAIGPGNNPLMGGAHPIFSPEEIKQFQEYERNPQGVPPPNYHLWRSLNKTNK